MNRNNLIIFFLIFGLHAKCQNYYFRHYMVEDGLTHNSVMCSLQDSRGFMWFGTKNGLNRFDGSTFKWFQNDPDNPNSLGSNFIQCLHQYNGYLWAGTDSGLFRYNKKSEKFKALPVTINKSIQAIESDNDGNLWFIANARLYKYDVGSNKFFRFDDVVLSGVVAIAKNEDGGIWVATANKLFYYVKTKNSFEKIVAFSENNPSVFINTIEFHSSEKLLIGTRRQGVFMYNTITKKVKKLFDSGQESLQVRNFAAKNKNELWIATEKGLYIYNFKNKTFKNLRKNYNDPYSLSDNALYCLTLDSEGGMWVGSYFGGLNYYPKQYTPFRKYFPKIGQNSISGNAVREIQKDDYGNLWIGTEDAGLNKFNPVTGKFTVFKHDKTPGSISFNNIHALLPRKDKLWIGTFEHGLDILDIKSGKVVHHYDAETLKSDFVYKFYERRNHHLLILTTAGIQEYDPQQATFSTYKPFSKPYFFNSFLEDNQGTQWAGTYRDGLFCYDPKTKTKSSYKNKRGDKKSLSCNAINTIFQDSKHRVWIGTENGLNLYDPVQDQFQRYTKKDGFPSNVIYAILEGDNNTLWITTSNGLTEFQPATNKVSVYTKINGLLSNQFNYNSAYQDEKGKMYFGGVGGMISFNPRTFRKNIFKPPIFITGIEVNNHKLAINKKGSLLKKSIGFSPKVTLKSDGSSFSLHFASLSYAAPNMTEYWYKLENLNNHWIYLGKKHQIHFTHLPPGKYNFMVKSRNKNGLWSKKSTNLQIEILPPFLESDWAYLIYFILGTAVVLVSFNYYQYRLKKKSNAKLKQLNIRKEQEIYQAKIEFFTNVVHEIRTPLTLIKSPLEKLLNRREKCTEQENRENLHVMEKNTSRLLTLVNQLLDFRKTDRVKLSFVEVNINNLIEDIYMRFSTVIKEKGVRFKLDAKPPNIKAFVDKEAVKKIISNLFNNAIKYCDSEVFVHLQANNKSFQLVVENDGKLISNDDKEKVFEPFFRLDNAMGQTGTGIGLALASSLAELHQGSLKLDTCNPSMNSFILNLPLHQNQEYNLYPSPQNSEEKTKVEPCSKTLGQEERKNVLIVEDDKDLLNFIAKDLHEKFRVLKASGTQEAFQIIKEENIQLIITDVMIGGLNGFSFCEIIKTRLESSHIPVIMLTAKSTLGSKIEGLESGADVYITKPFSMDYLWAQINSLFENRKNIWKHYSNNPLSYIGNVTNNKTNEAFVRKINGIILNNITDKNLNVEVLAVKMNMSRSTMYRKIKDISNLTPNELINRARLKKAAELLKTSDYKIYEVADAVGYKSQNSLGRNFQKKFNMTPTEYMNR